MEKEFCKRERKMADESKSPFTSGEIIARMAVRKLVDKQMVKIDKIFRKRLEEERKAAEFKWRGCYLNTGIGEDERLPLDDDFEQILISAERYALGRRTGIVSLTVRYIRRLIPRLTDQTLAILLRDMNEQKQLGKSFGMDFDEAEWVQLMHEIESELGERKRG